MNQCATYRSDLYYINTRVGGQRGTRSERIVSAWQWWLTYLVSPWKWERWRQFHVIREKDVLPPALAQLERARQVGGKQGWGMVAAAIASIRQGAGL
jgi:hypothetical protein